MDPNTIFGIGLGVATAAHMGRAWNWNLDAADVFLIAVCSLAAGFATEIALRIVSAIMGALS